MFRHSVIYWWLNCITVVLTAITLTLHEVWWWYSDANNISISKMACPFSRGFSRTRLEDEPEGGKTGGTRMNRMDRFRPCRQSSVQITSSLLGEEIDDQEDTQTLNLKHLRAAVLVLTNPSVTFYFSFLTYFYKIYFVNFYYNKQLE